MNELLPFTMEEMNNAEGEDKKRMLVEYHAWLDRERKQDKLEAERVRVRKNYHKRIKANPDYNKGLYAKRKVRKNGNNS